MLVGAIIAFQAARRPPTGPDMKRLDGSTLFWSTATARHARAQRLSTGSRMMPSGEPGQPSFPSARARGAYWATHHESNYLPLQTEAMIASTADRSLKILRRGIEVGNNFPELDFLQVWQGVAEDIMSSRHRSRIAHQTRDLRASGDEVEIPTRKLFREKLPASYHVGHGHIVDSTGRASPQYDIIIAETGAGPVFHRAASGGEYLAYESVYAIGEIKSCYYKSEDPIKTFVENVWGMKRDLFREKLPLLNPIGLDHPQNIYFDLESSYANPLFAFMVFASSGDFSPDDVKEFYKNTPDAQIPNAVCLIDRCVIMNMHVNRGDDGRLVPDRPVVIPEFNNKTPCPEHRWAWAKMGPKNFHEGANLAYLFFLVHRFLSQCRLSRPDLYEYMDRLQNGYSGDIFD